MRFDDDQSSPQFSPRKDLFPAPRPLPSVTLVNIGSGWAAYYGGGRIGLFKTLEEAREAYPGAVESA